MPSEAVERAVEGVEAAVGRLPSVYRFLLLRIGQSPMSCVYDDDFGEHLIVFNNATDVALSLDTWESRTSGLLEMGDDGGGDKYLLHVCSGRIYLWEHEFHDEPPLSCEALSPMKVDVETFLGAVRPWEAT